VKYFEFDNGDKMPFLGLGTWKSDKGEVGNAVIEALKLGYRHIDCAAVYLNEEEIGDALQYAQEKGIVSREELWVTSKLWNTEHERQHVVPALEKTLADLKLRYLDMYLIHWPVVIRQGAPAPWNPEDFQSLEELPVSETWKGMEEGLDSGLTRHIGVSNFSVKKLQDLIDSGGSPEMNQIELHPLLQQSEMLDFCRKNGIGLTAYAPLGSRDRPARLHKDTDPDLFKNEVITEIALNHACSPAQLLIAWGINRGTATIPKSVNPDRLKQNYDAAEIKLSNEEMEKITQLDRHYRYIDGGIWIREGNPYTMENLWDE